MNTIGSKKSNGDLGEGEVVRLVPCPNCKKELSLLPKSFPLCDVQCSACHLRAQVKSNNSRPKKEILGAGWEIVDKVTKSGYLVPSLITNNKWEENGSMHQEIRFYPFIPKVNLKMRQLSPVARRANYKMFNYVGLDKLPYFVLYKK